MTHRTQSLNSQVADLEGVGGGHRDLQAPDALTMSSHPLLTPTHGSLQATEPGDPSPPRAKRKRLVSLDAIRGLTVAVMILVDNLGGWFPVINHSPWNYVTLADFVMPFFLFMVGCSMSLSFKKYKSGVVVKVIKRTFKLFVLGLLTQGSDFPSLGNRGINLRTVRVPGILQRIAWAYFVVALIALYVPQRKVPAGNADYFRGFRVHAWQWLAALCFFFAYLVVMLGVRVPSWSHAFHGVDLTTACDVAGDLTPKCSAARWVDVELMGYKHMYSSGEFVRSHYCSTCPPEFCPKPLRCPEGVSCPTEIHDGWRFVNCTADPGSCDHVDFAPAWCVARLDPEGTLSSMPTVLTTFIGYHFGMVLQHFPDPGDRLRQWIPQAVALLVVGLVLQAAWWPASKQLWSPAYVGIMAGANGLFLAAFYSLLDYDEWQPGFLRCVWRPFGSRRGGVRLPDVLRPFVWVGMNTIFIYLMSPAAGLWEAIQGYVYWDTPDNNLIDSTYRGVYCGDQDARVGDMTYTRDECTEAVGCRWRRDAVCHAGAFAGTHEKWAQLVWILCRIAFWVGVAGVLHWRGWYWAL